MQQGKWMERIRWICWLNGVQKRTFYETVLIWGIRRMIMAEKVRDLRSALERLKNMPGQLAETDVAVDPMAELAGVYRYVGAGGTVKRPTKEGPAMIFRNIKGHPDASVAIGVLASRKRVAALLDCEPENLGKMLYHSVEKPVAPVEFQGAPPCQEVVHLATDPDFDLNRLVPAPTNTPDDAGPYITLGMCYASHPDTGLHDVTIHRLCIQGKRRTFDFLHAGCTPYRRDGRPCGGAWPETADFHQHRRRSCD